MSDIVSMALATPEDVDGDQVSQSTHDEATLRAATIRVGIGRFVDVVVPELAAAWVGRDWIALGYDSWEAYVTGELGVDRLKLSRLGRQQAIGMFRVAGMSQRAIGAALGVDPKTVRADIADGDIASPEHVTGVDGKTYRAAHPAPASEPEDDFGNKRSDYGDDDDLTDDDDFETFVDIGQDDPDDVDYVAGDLEDVIDDPADSADPPWPAEAKVIVLVCQAHGDPVTAELWEQHPTRDNIVKVVYTASRTGAWVAKFRLIDQACRHEPKCAGYPCPTANAEQHAADVAAVAPEYVLPVDRAGEWLEPDIAGGAVTSSTPGGATEEAPADIDPDVEYDGWRSRIYGDLSNAGRHLVNLSGDWQDADVFATRASEKQARWLADLAEKLADFAARVRALRSPTVEPVDPERALWRRAHAWAEADGPDVWIAAERQGVEYHRPTRELPDGKMHPLTGCRRQMNARGQLLGIAIAEFRFGSMPCGKCWPERVAASTEATADEVRGRAYAWQTRMKSAGADARIWMEARRGNLPYHRPVGLGTGPRRLVQLGCERERQSGGAYLEIGTAVSVHGAHPCPRCWPEEIG